MSDKEFTDSLSALYRLAIRQDRSISAITTYAHSCVKSIQKAYYEATRANQAISALKQQISNLKSENLDAFMRIAELEKELAELKKPKRRGRPPKSKAK